MRVLFASLVVVGSWVVAPHLCQGQPVDAHADAAKAAPVAAVVHVRAERKAEPVDVSLPYPELVYAALRRIVSRDLVSAEQLLEAAVEKAPDRPDAYCHLGDVARARADLERAAGMFQTCARFAREREDDRYARIAAVGEGMTLERMQGRREQARGTYEAVSASEDPTESEAWRLASERLKTLAAAGLLETVYAPVRERIQMRDGQATAAK